MSNTTIILVSSHPKTILSPRSFIFTTWAECMLSTCCHRMDYLLVLYHIVRPCGLHKVWQNVCLHVMCEYVEDNSLIDVSRVKTIQKTGQEKVRHAHKVSVPTYNFIIKKPPKTRFLYSLLFIFHLYYVSNRLNSRVYETNEVGSQFHRGKIK